MFVFVSEGIVPPIKSIVIAESGGKIIEGVVRNIDPGAESVWVVPFSVDNTPYVARPNEAWSIFIVEIQKYRHPDQQPIQQVELVRRLLFCSNDVPA